MHLVVESRILSNKSVHTIRFVPGYGSRLFAYNSANENWEEIENLVNYVGDGDVLDPHSSGTKNWVAYFTVKPNLQKFESFSLLRIAVAGIALDTADQSTVGTFIDIPLVSN